jgi:hypothetical protein
LSPSALATWRGPFPKDERLHHGIAFLAANRATQLGPEHGFRVLLIRIALGRAEFLDVVAAPVSTSVACSKLAHSDDVSFRTSHEGRHDSPHAIEVDARDEARECVRHFRDEIVRAVLPEP